MTALLALSGLGCIGFAACLYQYNVFHDLEDPIDLSTAAVAIVLGMVDLIYCGAVWLL